MNKNAFMGRNFQWELENQKKNIYNLIFDSWLVKKVPQGKVELWGGEYFLCSKKKIRSLLSSGFNDA